MLIVIRGIVTLKINRTPTFFEIHLQETLEDASKKTYKIVGNSQVLGGMERDADVVLIGKKDVHPKYGAQVKPFKWWFATDCPFANNLHEAEETMTFLAEDLSLPPAMSERIFGAYGTRARAVIEKNPYDLVNHQMVPRLSVNDVDKRLAPRYGIESTDPKRLRASLFATLRQAKSLQGIPVFTDDASGQSYGDPGGGHAYADYTQIVCLTADDMGIKRSLVKQELAAMATEPRNPIDLRPLIVIEKQEEENEDGQLIQKDRFIYPQAIHHAERGASYHVNRLLGGHSNQEFQDLPISTAKVKLSEEQEQAVRTALTNKFVLLTGGPGVGKTTIIDALCKSLDRIGARYCLCAPTGIAARRMSKATGEDAFTIHKLLAVNPVAGSFQMGEDCPLQTDFVIADESSMISLDLMFSLLDAIPSQAHVLLVGDADQLPPVGTGAPFRDLISSNKIPTVRLTKIYRQEMANSLIIQTSRNILERKPPAHSKNPTEGDLFVFTYPGGKDDKAVEMILELLTKKLPETFKISPRDIQILCPHRRQHTRKAKKDENGEYASGGKLLSTEALNPLIQERLVGKPAEGMKFVVGDRVIHTKNDYNLGVMNGEIGYVSDVSTEMHGTYAFVKYVVQYTEKKVVYEEKDWKMKLDLAYALSVHRYQGSEAPCVIVIAYAAHGFYTRNMFYTAVTRGKRYVCIVTPPWKHEMSMAKILQTDEPKRNSRLVWRMQNDNFDDWRSARLRLDEFSDGDEA
jgi:RecD/TraA family predicted helicase